MATLQDTSALNALNEKDYINKLYDTNTDSQKKLLDQNYKDNTGLLDTEQKRVQQQTQENVNRTQVEAASGQNTYNGSRVSAGGNTQAALARDNALQENVTDLNKQQQSADAEINRQRQLLASQYEAAIRQAQADNDMERAQALYTAAKEEEAKLLSLRKSASTLLAEKEDTSIRDALLRGETPSADFTGGTWEQVLKNEEQLNEIYDKQLESQLLELQTENEEALSDLQAEQRKKQAKTDEDLTQAYVDSLKNSKNYAESQTARGMGSGAFGQAQLAQDLELQDQLTEIRKQQMQTDAGYGIQEFNLGREYRDKAADATDEVNTKRAEELLKAAEQEETSLYETQLTIGQELAEDGDYSVLGKLYGLTQDQIDRLQGTGKYAVGGGGGGYGGGSSSGGSSGYYKNWSNTSLMDKANAGIANYESKGNSVSGNKTLSSPTKTKSGTK